MGQKLIDAPDRFLKAKLQNVIDDDFNWYVTAHQWITTATDSGTVAASDAVNGIIVLTPSDGTVTNNDEAYLSTNQEVFKFGDGKTLVGECRLQFTEGNTDDVNVFFGFADAIGANTLVDDGAGLKTSFSGAAIYKVDGGTVWKCVSSIGTTQTISTSTTTSSSSSYQRLKIECLPAPTGGSTMEIAFYVDGKPLIDSTTNKRIKHTVTTTSATEMDVGCGIKNGADTTAEALNVDYISVVANR